VTLLLSLLPFLRLLFPLLLPLLLLFLLYFLLPFLPLLFPLHFLLLLFLRLFLLLSFLPSLLHFHPPLLHLFPLRSRPSPPPPFLMSLSIASVNKRDATCTLDLVAEEERGSPQVNLSPCCPSPIK